jgi:hypothetical protein
LEVLKAEGTLDEEGKKDLMAYEQFLKDLGAFEK